LSSHYTPPRSRPLAPAHITYEVGLIAHPCGVRSPRELKRLHAQVIQPDGRILPLDQLYPDVIAPARGLDQFDRQVPI